MKNITPLAASSPPAKAAEPTLSDALNASAEASRVAEIFYEFNRRNTTPRAGCLRTSAVLAAAQDARAALAAIDGMGALAAPEDIAKAGAWLFAAARVKRESGDGSFAILLEMISHAKPTVIELRLACNTVILNDERRRFFPVPQPAEMVAAIKDARKDIARLRDALHALQALAATLPERIERQQQIDAAETAAAAIREEQQRNRDAQRKARREAADADHTSRPN